MIVVSLLTTIPAPSRRGAIVAEPSAGISQSLVGPQLHFPATEAAVGGRLLLQSVMAQDINVLISHVSNSEDFKTVKAYEIFRSEGIPDGLPQTNMEYSVSKKTVLDGRTRHGELNIKTQGFHFLYHKFGRSLTADDIRGPEGPALMDRFLREVEEVMKKDLEAEKVCIYDWRVRVQRLPDKFEILTSTVEE
jgi:hypothetical protein